MRVTLAALQAAIMRSQSATLVAIGFSQRMCLPVLGSSNNVLRVHGVRQHDVDHFDFRVLGKLIVVLAVVNRRTLDAVLRGNLAGFISGTADQGYRFAVLGMPEGQEEADRWTGVRGPLWRSQPADQERQRDQEHARPPRSAR